MQARGNGLRAFILVLVVCVVIQLTDAKKKDKGVPEKKAEPVPEKSNKPKPKPIKPIGGDSTKEPDYVKGMRKISGTEELGDQDVEQSIFVPKGATLKITADSLRLNQGTRIIVQGKLEATASGRDAVISIKSGNKNMPGAGISCIGGTLILNGVEFKDLGNPAIQPTGVLALTDCDATIKGCDFINTNGTAIHSSNGKLTAMRNKFSKVHGTCISAIGTNVYSITTSTFDGCEENAVSIRKATTPISIDKNVFTKSGAYAVSLDQCYAPFKVNGNNFTGGNYGAFKARSILYTREDKLITGSEFNENNIDHNDVDVSSDFYAKGNILYFDSVAATVSDNIVADNTFDMEELEKHNKKQAKDLTGSVINMWDCLIKMERNIVQRSKQFNRILTCGGQQKGVSKYNLTQNLFINNTAKFVIFNDGPALIDATKNYWGVSGKTYTAKGWVPDHIFDFEDAPQKSGVVDYEPWLSEPKFDAEAITAKDCTEQGPEGGYGDNFGGEAGEGYDADYYGYNAYTGYNDDYGLNYYADYNGDYTNPGGAEGGVGGVAEPKHTIIKKAEKWETDIDVVKNVIVTKTGYLLIWPTNSHIVITMLRGSYIRVDGVLQVYGDSEYQVTFQSDEFDDEGWRSIFFAPAAVPFNFAKLQKIGESGESPAADWGCFISHANFKGGGVMPKEAELSAGDDDKKKKKKKRNPLTPNQVGMVIVAGTTLYVEASEFSNSFSSGLVTSEHVNSTLYVDKKCSFKNNLANGISHRSKTQLVVMHSTFVSNSEYAIITKQGLFNVTNNRFTDNEGGVMCVAVKRSTVEKKADALDDLTSYFTQNRVERNTFAQGDSCWSPDSDKEYRLAAFGSGSVNIELNDFIGNLAPQEAVRNNAELVMIRADKAVRFVDNKVEDCSGTIYLGSFFVAEKGHVPNPMEVLTNNFVRNNHFGIVVTANTRRVRFASNNITDCSVSERSPFPDTPIVMLRGHQDLRAPMEVVENEFLGNDGSQVFMRAQAPFKATDNLFDNPYMKAELWVEHDTMVSANNNWWGNETSVGVARRIRGPNGNSTVDASIWRQWMLANGQYHGSAEHLTDNKQIPGKVTPKRKSDGGAGAGVVVIVIIFVMFIIGLVVMFVRKSRGGSLTGPSRPYKPVN